LSASFSAWLGAIIAMISSAMTASAQKAHFQEQKLDLYAGLQKGAE